MMQITLFCLWKANHFSRLILYFPVSALVTLFGNILQNPLDPRAKSDTKLMNLVVTFLSTLGQEAETGGVHRMLGVCSEFERIAKIVIDKSERDTSKRKRKSHEHYNNKSSVNNNNSNSHASPSQYSSTHTPRPTSSSAATPTPGYANSTMSSQLSPKFNGEQNRANNAANGGYSPMDTTNHSNNNNNNNDSSRGDGRGGESNDNGWPPATSQQEWNPDVIMDFGNFSDLTGFGQSPPPMPPANAVANPGYQPLLPQELWQMSGGLDWDWADITGGAYPSFENGGNMDRG